MRRITTILLLLYLLSGCSSPKIEYPDYKFSISDSSREKILKKMEAEEDQYSILMFTAGYEKRLMAVFNCDTEIFKDTVNTDRVLDLAESFKINNTCSVIITDVDKKYSFSLKSKHITKYKYVYISRDWDSGKYTVAYSNSLRGFY